MSVVDANSTAGLAAPVSPPPGTGAARRRAAFNMAANVGGYLLTATVAFFIWPLQVHTLGNEAYGLWALLQQLIAYSTLLDFGVRIAVLRNTARAQAAGDAAATERFVSTAFFMMLAPAFIILLAGAAATVWLPGSMGIAGALLPQARIAIILATVTVAMTAPGALFNGCVAAVSRYDLLNLRNACIQIVRALLLWYLLTHGFALVAVASVFLATEALGVGLDLTFSLRHVTGLRVHWRGFDPGTVRELLNFGFFAFLISIAVRLAYWSDNLVVGFMAGAAAVTFYSVAGSLVQYLRDGLTNFTSVLGPMFAQMDAVGEHQALRYLYRVGSKVAMAAIMPGVLFLVFEGRNFLLLWMGAEMAARATLPLILLALSALTIPAAAMYSHVLYATARHQLSGWLALVESATNLGLSVFLIGRMGISGVALGTLIPAVFFQLLVLPVYTSRVLDISIWSYWRDTVILPLLAAIPTAAGLLWANRHAWTSSWPGLIAAGLLLTVAYAVTAWFAVLARDQRRRFAQAIRSRWSQRRGVADLGSQIA